MPKKLTLLLISVFASYTTYAQDFLPTSMDSLVSSQIKLTEPGCAILVAKGKKIIYKKAFGSANMELGVPLDPDMVFRIGSVTKQFTAIAILQLVEQGKIGLKDSIQRYLKDFPSKGYTITIENLLTHTSGIIDYSSMNHPDPYVERRDFTPKYIFDFFKNEPLQFQPGTKFAYSNSNYFLLGYLIEQLTGKGYHEYMKQNILEPAGLHSTYYTHERDIIPKRVTGYTRDKGYYENSPYQSISMGYACGDLMSTLEDLYKWNNALLANQLIKKETLQQAFTPYPLKQGVSSYGYGWFIDSLEGSRCIHHEGQVSGFIAEEKYFPAEDIYAVLLTNLKSGEDMTGFSDTRFRLFDDIFRMALGKTVQANIALSETLMDKYIGTYLVDSLYEKDGIRKTKVNTGERIIISKKNNHLYATLSNKSGVNMLLQPQTDTFFVLPDVTRIHTTIAFEMTNGTPTSLYWSQERKSQWKKIE
ncbi:MAG: beta-lactamase family protein [Chitinophaga sp.]|uniref:serine hydrolase domain-containing protein n=1 Tax=Chitinophaga sp. TaxID=1869181 RepID=UPI0025C55B78|nr:serine hydrolase domain-containing protein [Chitinophaga sp.]MBV8253660.1 beta-lactamase family protein [Chitinophaga sp.]